MALSRNSGDHRHVEPAGRNRGYQLLRWTDVLARSKRVKKLTCSNNWCAAGYSVDAAECINPIAPSQAVHGFDWNFTAVHKGSIAKPSIVRLWLHRIQAPTEKREAQIDVEAGRTADRHVGVPES